MIERGGLGVRPPQLDYTRSVADFAVERPAAAPVADDRLPRGESLEEMFEERLTNSTTPELMLAAAKDLVLATVCDAITGATGGLIDLSSWATALAAEA